MTDYRSLSGTSEAGHVSITWCLDRRSTATTKVIYTELRRYLGDVLRRLAQRRESEVGRRWLAEYQGVDATLR